MDQSKLISREACPKCRGEGHDNHGDNLAVYDDGHSYCYRCGYFRRNNNEDFILSEHTYEYLPLRGIKAETFRFFDVKTKIDQDGRPVSIGFRFPNGAFKVRSLTSKSFHWSGEAQSSLFGTDKFAAGSSKFVTITEGELDALSIYQATGTPCVSVRSASSAVGDVSVLRSWLNQYDRICLAFDNDAAGREATANVAKLFDYNKLLHCKFTNRKDANEYLQHGEEDVLRKLWWAARPYQPESITSTLDDFKDILTKDKPKGVPYPFPTLTKMTYGIRTGETVLFKAPEKVGKTAIMHAILHHLLKETEDNVGAIFIEEPKQRLLQSIAGLELKSPVHLPDSVHSDIRVWEAVRDAVKKDDRLFIYSHFGTNDPDVLLDTIRFLVTARNCRYVVFDHISMAVTGLAGEKDERRALEYLASRLEMMVKELNFALLMVSHVNDIGQTRGSHYLTKVADITVNAERDSLADNELTRRTIQLSIPYNRFCSSTGVAGRLVFDPVTYTLQEEQANDGYHGAEEPSHRALLPSSGVNARKKVDDAAFRSSF